MRNAYVGFDNTNTWADYQFYDPAKRGAVTVFTEVNCTGISTYYLSPEDQTRRADYPVSYIDYDTHNNTISSFMLPTGYTVEFWDGDAMTGEMHKYDGVSWADNDYGMVCQNLGSFDNRMSSITVYRTDANYAIGKWNSITATEGFTFEY